MQENYIISCQVWEWYGDADHVGEEGYGRYKPKGGCDFAFESGESTLYKERELIAMFNKRYNAMGRFFRYEAREISYYVKPAAAMFVDGEIRIEFPSTGKQSSHYLLVDEEIKIEFD